MGTCLAVAFLQLCQSQVQRSQRLPVVLGLDFQQLPDRERTNSAQFSTGPSWRYPHPQDIAATWRQGEGGAARGTPWGSWDCRYSEG